MKEELEEQEQDIWKKFLVPIHPSRIIKVSRYLNHESRFNGVSSINNLPRIKDAANVINLDDKKSKGTHRVPLFFDKNTAVYFDTFRI